jgi:hypothetical protein
MNARTAEWVRIGILGLGVVSAWSALVVQFRTFLAAYGTLFHVSTTVASNPLLTPCLYGSLAFLGAFAWAIYLYVYPNERSDVWLNRLLLFGVVFAAVVVLYDCADYFHLFRFGVPLVCTPGVNPLYTPCFRGLIFFAAAFATGFWIRKGDATERI